ncbi:hypothetical protein [Nostoc sp. 'Peltigera membranacea cyanobiont' 232]|uniref:hypothetical protein n=1 Tax=Nostoc sp. 'Peltigera membranacea cyanobiont' 232 TaxID=2014531 RepID=UPI001CB937F6|nr:hypothetical protein [Nostoc sp. 'Peltigera membranacea cyanobiont' 232]
MSQPIPDKSAIALAGLSGTKCFTMGAFASIYPQCQMNHYRIAFSYALITC